MARYSTAEISVGYCHPWAQKLQHCEGTQCPVIWEGKETEAEPTVLNVHPKGSFFSFLLSFLQKPCHLKTFAISSCI